MIRLFLPLLLMLLMLLLLPVTVRGQALVQEETVRVTPSNTELEIGDPMTLRLEFRDHLDIEDLEVSLPGDQRTLLRIGRARMVEPGVFEVPVRPMRGGAMEYGPLVMKLKLEGRQQPLELESGSFYLDVAVPPEGEIGELRDFKSPQEMAFSYLLRNLVLGGAAVAGLGLLALGAYGVFLVAKRRHEEGSRIPPVPPIVRALECVRRLKNLDVYHSHGSERHYTELSMSLRRYIEEEMGYHAVEMTEDEVVDLIRGDLSDINKAETLIELFRRSSMAKFARFPMDQEMAAGDVEAAESFLVAEEARLKALEAIRKEEEQRAAREREKATK